MSKFCPILGRGNGPLLDCSDYCIMYSQESGECIIKKALEVYIKNYTPVTVKPLTKEEVNRLEETLMRHPTGPVLFKHPNLNSQHDYDEYGVDWYPPGPNDIAP